jgi:hypothetical protein
MPKPIEGTYPVYFGNYIKLVPEDNITDALNNQQPLVDNFFDNISEEKSSYAYAEGKWTLKELLQHLIDAERIFNFRSLAIARGEKQSLPGFDENDYAAVSEANKRSWNDLVEEFKAVRKATTFLLNSFTVKMMESEGFANKKKVSVNALAFIIVGHVYHHIKIIELRYLND